MNREDYTKEECWIVADCLAAERLARIDAYQDDVVPSSTLYARFFKRLLDIAISGVALLVTLPLNAILLICTVIDVGTPVMFKQERVGRNERSFYLYKFRNMRNTTDEDGNLLPAAQRVTRFGKFVRRTSLDELLNFWSILKGEMSLIGPRPLLPEYSHRYTKRHRARLLVRPGLECPPHILKEGAWTWQDQFENDIWYVENVSFRTDMRMLLNLFKYALDPKSSAVRGGARRTAFMGYSVEGKALSVDEVPDEYARHALGERWKTGVDAAN